MNFSEYTFGFADANTEFLRIENYFDNVFTIHKIILKI